MSVDCTRTHVFYLTTFVETHKKQLFCTEHSGDRDEVDKRDKGDKPRWGSPEWPPVLVAFTGVFGTFKWAMKKGPLVL